MIESEVQDYVKITAEEPKKSKRKYGLKLVYQKKLYRGFLSNIFKKTN